MEISGLLEDTIMTYKEALTREINSLPAAFLPEVLDFVLYFHLWPLARVGKKS
jgi:hypothetical protein